MPIEVLDAPVSQAELGPKPFSKEPQPADLMDDEFGNTDLVPLRPLSTVVTTEEGKQVDLTSHLEEQFAHLSRTRNLETDTVRTKILQELVLDRLTEGENIRTKVVIMLKGEESEAFVMPDGTIFVSQSLLNKLDSLDEVAAVLAHEVSHLIYKTSFKIAQERGARKVGVAWVHEEACDQKAPELLEKTGFNSLAFSSAIEKISGTERGVVHQSGLSRASLIVGQHMAIERTTSSTELTPLPAILRDEVKRTNLEIVKALMARPANFAGQARHFITGKSPPMSGEQAQQIRETIRFLHPKDLEEFYYDLALTTIFRVNNVTALRLCSDLIMERLSRSGFKKEEAVLFVLTSLERYGGLAGGYETRLIQIPQILSNLVDAVDDFDKQNKFAPMYRLIFASSRDPGADAAKETLLNGLYWRGYDVGFSQREGISISQQTLVEVLDKIYHANWKHGQLNQQRKSELISRVVASYLIKTHLTLAAQARQEIDFDQIKALFLDFKERGVMLSRSIIEYNLSGRNILDYFYHDEKAPITAENLNLVKRALREVFGAEEREIGFREIDQFFQEFVNIGEYERAGELTSFLGVLRNYLDIQELNDGQRQKYLEYIKGKIDSLDLPIQLPINTYVLDRENVAFNKLALRFNLKMIFALSLYERDGEEFYSFLREAMADSGLDINHLTRDQILGLCQGFFIAEVGKGDLLWLGRSQPDYVRLDKGVLIKDYAALLNLPWMAKIWQEDFAPQSLKDLNSHLQSLFSLQVSYGSQGDRQAWGLFSDSLWSLSVLEGARGSFLELIKRGFQEEDYPELYQLIDNFYSEGPQKGHFLRELNKIYLHSPHVSIEDKTDYLVRFFDSVGPEGMVIVADQITDMTTYQKFRQKIEAKLKAYLEESGITTTLALGDILSSFLMGHFDALLQTAVTDPDTKAKISTTLAHHWFGTTDYELGRGDGFSYDRDQHKFLAGQNSRKFFRTLSDSFAFLRNLNSLQRFGIAHKALVDRNGALTSPENRKTLANRLIASLGLGRGFVSSLLRAACEQADAKLIAFPASSMIGPLLFRSLDVDAVDITRLGKTVQTDAGKYGGESEQYVDLNKVLTAGEISSILRASTREISLFGPRFQGDPSSFVAALAQGSDFQYQVATDRLSALFGKEEASVAVSGGEINSGIEAVIKGVERSGALGIRALQLASQFHQFPPPLERRLSDAFDANPGLNKLLFWENLHKLSLEDQAVAEFMERLTLGEYLGGGSLQTTYAATYTDESGRQRPIIVKMKNPNVEAFIRQGYDSAHKSLEVVVRGGRGREREYAKVGMALMDLAQNWCLDDLNDKTFIADDDLFHQTVERFNARVGSDQFYVPHRLFTSLKLKSEDLAAGETVNRLLNNDRVDLETKRRAISAMARFFAFQMKGNAFVNADGKRFYLIHSDPHVGNYIADVSEESPRIGVIDRSLYLKLVEDDIKVLERLVVNGNNTEFANSFISRVLDINKVRGVQRLIIQNRVFAKLAVEVAQQMARSGVNRFALMRTMLTELSNAKMDVPLNLRLMIRNIEAFRQLGRRYGVDFEALYKEAA